ncbi:Glu-tRNA(Gln) amidotransferase GatDE subunit E [bacterium]|nr:MAG: Glu-tRNA(Gln) amidotransferase GatDE subunit E [bacterium]RKZ15505.1 MAG: Glu-tRNA(Gln) amidotransferase GatDE subunit E [bacterium]
MTRDPRELSSQLKPPDDVNPRTDARLDFEDREFGEMSEADYAEIGFMGGLEVHQQLDTETKLFCRCPSGVYVQHFDAEVLRHMRPTLSELGEYDGTALMEFKTRKEIIYQLERGSVCTYEIDDTPPFEINEEAVKVSLEVCELFGMDLISELHVMRKQYLDGSIPTGFQRTAMIGLAGRIPFRVPELGIDRELNIRQLSLEEDSCREISDIGHRVTFRTDRLGMPLTEVVTEPEFFSPLELQAGARLIADTTRACTHVRRGPGAARQDVNVSIAGGRRVEIKGVSNHRGLPRLVHNEAFRQLNLLRLREELRQREVESSVMDVGEADGVTAGTDLVIDATSILRRSDYAPLCDALDAAGSAYAIRLPRFGGLLVHRTQPGITFASELADRVRVIACLVGRPFMLHSDIEGYGLRAAEWRQLHNALGAGSEDSVIVVFGPTRDCDTAAREVLIRAQEAIAGIPAETRQSMPDGTTGFERILPGADRMYPDTDTPPMPIPDAWVAEARKLQLERAFERATRYRKTGLTDSAADRLSRAAWSSLFDELDLGQAASTVESAFAHVLPGVLRKGTALPDAGRLHPWVEAIREGWLLAEAIRPALRRIIADPGVEPADVLARYRISPDTEQLAQSVAAIAGEFAGLHSAYPAARVRWAMGRLRQQWLGHYRASEVLDQISRQLESTEVTR